MDKADHYQISYEYSDDGSYRWYHLRDTKTGETVGTSYTDQRAALDELKRLNSGK